MTSRDPERSSSWLQCA